MENFLTIIDVVEGLSALTVVLMFVFKPFRIWFLRLKDNKEEEENELEWKRCVLRTEIVSLYFRHRLDCEMHSYEFENLCLLYKEYKKLGGNSFIDKVWDEIQEWKIVP